jgi:glycosyltransferase involved in cell wall biosynthesis
MSASPGRALVLVENLSVPFDRRVWHEVQTLRDAGYDVTVVCPRGESQDTEPHVEVGGIDIHRFPLRFATGGHLGYIREYSSAMLRMASLVNKLARRRRFDVVHACNPPDGIVLSALPLRRRGAAFIFDHHDLVPELFVSRFGRRGPVYRATILAERVAFRMSHVVISTNDSYRRVAIERGRKRPEDVFVVRSAPRIDHFRPVAPDDSLRKGRSHLLAYVGVMGPQDGVDHALRALATLAALRDDWRALFIGSGDVFSEMKSLSRELGLAEVVEFTGRIPDEDVVRILSSADVCLSPDPKNPLNDVSTMNKVLEYMAMGKPIVSYELVEARVSAGDAAIYVSPNDTEAFARGISDLLDDPARRRVMGEAGRLRIGDLSWAKSEPHLLAAYERARFLRRAQQT